MRHALAVTAVVLAGALAGSAAEAQHRRTPLTQPGCEICIIGTPSVQWSGNSASFHVDRVENRGNPWKADLGLYIALTSKYPDLGVPTEIGSGSDLFELYFSDIVWLAPLSPGTFHSNIDSGAIRFDGSKVPAGEYWMSVVLFDCPYPCLYEDYVVMNDKVLCDGSSCAVRSTGPPPTLSITRLLPIVVDVSNGSAHYTTEIAVTNNTYKRLAVEMLYTASLGSKEGSGTVTDSLAPGEQKQISEVLSYLRDQGLSIPPSQEEPTQGGTLLVTFDGNETIDPKLVSVTARTAAVTSAPHPIGRAGLAYSGLLPWDSPVSSLTLFGLRSTSTDRTNVAVFNTSGDPVTLKVTVHSGSGDGKSVVFREAETLPPYGWLQYGSAQILDQNGITTGWATVERTSTTGSFSAYAAINDSLTNDGSFVPPVGGAVAGSTLTVPYLAEGPGFRSELVLSNKSDSSVSLTLDYHEADAWGVRGKEGTMTLHLAPHEQRIIPEAIDFLRTNGVDMKPRNTVGALQITVSGTETENVFAGARSGGQSPGGGQFSLFTPGVYSGAEASQEAYLYGLREDTETSTCVSVVNTGADSDGPILLQFQAYDGDAGGVAKGYTDYLTLRPGQWEWPGPYVCFFGITGVSNGWVKVTRMSGTAPWIAYAEVIDLRTGDSAYVPMVR
jgi:hypothetical protein